MTNDLIPGGGPEAVGPPIELSAGDDAASDTGRNRQVNDIVEIASSAEEMLAERGGIGVIFEHDGNAESSLDYFTQWEFAPQTRYWAAAPTVSLLWECLKPHSQHNLI